MSIYLEDYVPVVKWEGLNTTKTISGTGTITAGTGFTATTGDLTLTTGNVVVTAAGGGVSFTGTGTSGGILTNLYNAATSTLSGTQRDIKILLGTVPYYITCYPTKA